MKIKFPIKPGLGSLFALLLVSCVGTKSASEMRRIQEEEGMFAGGGWMHESIFYAGSTKRYHYLWQQDFTPWSINDNWRVFRVPKSELTLDGITEVPYDSSTKHDQQNMRYAAISNERPYKLVKRMTMSEKLDKFENEIRTGERKVRVKTETLRDGSTKTSIGSKKVDADASHSTPLPVPPPP